MSVYNSDFIKRFQIYNKHQNAVFLMFTHISNYEST